VCQFSTGSWLTTTVERTWCLHSSDGLSTARVPRTRRRGRADGRHLRLRGRDPPRITTSSRSRQLPPNVLRQSSSCALARLCTHKRVGLQSDTYCPTITLHPPQFPEHDDAQAWNEGSIQAGVRWCCGKCVALYIQHTYRRGIRVVPLAHLTRQQLQTVVERILSRVESCPSIPSEGVRM
jgi:hypothetical protein